MAAFVVLPPAPVWLSDRLSEHSAVVHVIEPVPGPDDVLAARVCAAINALEPVAPLVIVSCGSAAQLLPAVARAQHSAHRRVIGYLLVDPDLPSVSDTWPDAPVTVITRDDWTATHVRLRGWELLDEDALPAWLATDGQSGPT